jgi:tRNA wybutosine-synthesizing protein 2
MCSQKVEESPRKAAGRTRRPNNALQAGVVSYLITTNHGLLDIKLLPKKYTAYPPLLILPVNFTSTTPEWESIYRNLSQAEKHELFTTIAVAFKPQTITHIVINAAISPSTSEVGSQNVTRSPSGITPVYGDFGPVTLLHPDRNRGQPTQADFDAAFWVSTPQNGGIIQTWAPLWTMFSRGNISEKARILGEGNGMRGLTLEEVGGNLSSVQIADFYVGIGYFAFSYLKMGVNTVFGWEINGWSVEGLRRGCERNGWECVVVRTSETGQLDEGGLENIVRCLQSHRRSKCIVLWGDNDSAARTLLEIQRSPEKDLPKLSLRHVNLGLLPTAKDSWGNAVRILDAKYGGWVHVHENVDTREIEIKRQGLAAEFNKLALTTREGTWQVSCCHVEQVKTYAPGIMHCVFDIEITG